MDRISLTSMLSIACVIVTLMLMSDGMQQHGNQLTWEGGSSQILHFQLPV